MRNTYHDQIRELELIRKIIFHNKEDKKERNIYRKHYPAESVIDTTT